MKINIYKYQQSFFYVPNFLAFKTMPSAKPFILNDSCMLTCMRNNLMSFSLQKRVPFTQDWVPQTLVLREVCLSSIGSSHKSLFHIVVHLELLNFKHNPFWDSEKGISLLTRNGRNISGRHYSNWCPWRCNKLPLEWERKCLRRCFFMPCKSPGMPFGNLIS